MDVSIADKKSFGANRRSPFLNKGVCGVMIPLFSIRSAESFGVGEILDLLPLIDWMSDHHLHLLQILPIYETSPYETSPYQALSGFALDPIYLSLLAWDDFNQSEAAHTLTAPSFQQELGRLRDSKEICYEEIRALKAPLLEQSFDSFLREEWIKKSERARLLQQFIEKHAEWLNDYVLFRLLKEQQGWRYWKEWPLVYRDRDAAAMRALEQKNETRLLFFKYLQWALWEQWKQVRAYAREKNVLMMGDLPFLVSQDSADIWTHRDAFSAVDSVGAPPDVFNDQGQDWGLPLFDWKEMERKDFFWWRLRIRHARALFNLIRLDHVVGFYRVWVIPQKGKPYFEPSEEPEQIRRGAAFLNAIIEEAGDCIPVAEDLGVIPDFVRESLTAFGIAGHKILRWEKDDLRYRDPKAYPFVSLATTGTHDTSTLLRWWNEISPKERAAFLAMLNGENDFSPADPFSERLHQAILARLLDAGSGLVVFPIQDILGLPDQINIPATVGRHNWRFRLPSPLRELQHTSPFKEQLESLKSFIDRHDRWHGGERQISPSSAE